MLGDALGEALKGRIGHVMIASHHYREASSLHDLIHTLRGRKADVAHG